MRKFKFDLLSKGETLKGCFFFVSYENLPDKNTDLELCMPILKTG